MTNIWRDCPFCGGSPHYELIPAHETSLCVNGKPIMPPVPDSHIIECGCGCGLIDDTKEKLLERWNNRPHVRISPTLSYQEVKAIQADNRKKDSRIEVLEKALNFYAKRQYLIFGFEPHEPKKYFNYYSENDDCDVWVEGGNVAQLALKSEASHE